METIMAEIIDIIKSVGFPIVACAGMAWWIKYITDQFNTTIVAALTSLNTTVEDLKDTILSLKEDVK